MKRICSIFLALVVLLMAGCASSQSDETTPGTIQPAESTQGTLLTESCMPALSVDEIYTEYLTALCAKLKNII